MASSRAACAPASGAGRPSRTRVNWFAEGKWVHLAKIAFERYCLRKMRNGTSEHVFERMVLRALGIMKLKP